MNILDLPWNRETWSITVAVTLYVFAAGMNVRHNVWLRLAIPLALSILLHTVRFFMRMHIDPVQCISDLLYDYFAPIGIYRVTVMIYGQVKRKRGGKNEGI